jgi:hypothetical protein
MFSQLNVNYGAQNWQMQQLTSGVPRPEVKSLAYEPSTIMPNALVSSTSTSGVPSTHSEPNGSPLSNGQVAASGPMSPARPTSACTALPSTSIGCSFCVGSIEPTATLQVQCGFCSTNCRLDASTLTLHELHALSSPARHQGLQWKCAQCQQHSPLVSIEQQLQNMSRQLFALISTVDTLAMTGHAQRPHNPSRSLISAADPENSMPNATIMSRPPTSAPMNSTILGHTRSRALRTLPLDFTPIVDKPTCLPLAMHATHRSDIRQPDDTPESVFSESIEPYEQTSQHVHIYMDSGDEPSSPPQYSSERVIGGRAGNNSLQTPVITGPCAPDDGNHLQSRNQSLHLLSCNLPMSADRANQLKSQSCDESHHYSTAISPPLRLNAFESDVEPEIEHIMQCVDIPLPVIPVKEYLPCVLSHIESPNEFYVHVTDEEVNNAIDDLSEQLSNCYVNGREYPFSQLSSSVLCDQLLGRYFAAFYPTDQNWYRVRVVHVQPNLRTCTVQYVDYGNTEQLSVDDLNYLRPELAETPELAIRCSLAHVQPTGRADGGKWIGADGWTEEQTLCFQGVSGFDREQVVTAHVLQIVTNPLMKVEVLLWNNSGPEGSGSRDVLINLWMARQGLALSDRLDLLEEVERCANQALTSPCSNPYDGELDVSLITTDPPLHSPPQLPEIGTVPLPSRSPPPPPPSSAPISANVSERPESPTLAQWNSLDATHFRSDYPNLGDWSCSDAPEVIGSTPPFITTYPTQRLKVGRTVFMKITHADSPHQFYGVLPFGFVSYDRVNVETEKQLMERLKTAPESLKYRELCMQMK